MIIRKYDNKYIIKIMKEKIKNFNLYNQEDIKDLFQKIIIKIKKKYHLSGLLDVDVYVNEYYGMIIEIEPLYSYFDEIDMSIHFHLDYPFMVEINENEIEHQKEIYYYKNKFYTLYKGLTDSDIIYRTNNIVEKGIKVI